MDCKLIDCDAEATSRVFHPFGTVNVCEEHAVALSAWEPEIAKAMFEVMRFGPKEDPPLDDDDRGLPFPEGRYPKFVRRGPITDVLRAFDGGRAACYCVHDKRWPEGDHFEGDGEGRACRECVMEATRVFQESLAS